VARHTSFPEPISLYTERLCLRTPTPRDAEALYELFADAVVMKGLGREPVSAVEDVRAMIDAMIIGWRTEGLGPFVFETAAADRTMVGQAGVMIFDTRGWTPSTWADAGSHAQPELGWALIRAHWGHGYATEAATAIREWAYEHRPIRQLVSLISADNLRSQRVAERLGAVSTETITPLDSGREAVVWRHPPGRGSRSGRSRRTA
jgi:RimJ/RimL family protein N-acetyltransferase